MTTNIIRRLNSVKNLPTIPEIALRAQQIIYSDEGDAAALARLIEQDPSISAKVLQLANSSFYSAANRISSVSTAITRLGFNEIGDLVIATAVIKAMSQQPSRYLDYKQFWRHALTAAQMAGIAAQANGVRSGMVDRHSLYLSGLMHDIGILIYDQFFHEEFQEILDYAAEHELSYLEAERAAAPKDSHAALGAALLEIWKLTPAVINGVRFHHSPERAPDKQKTIPCAIYLSEYILCNSRIGSFEGVVERHDGVGGVAHIGATELPEYMKRAEAELEKSDILSTLSPGGGTGPQASAPPAQNLFLRTI